MRVIIITNIQFVKKKAEKKSDYLLVNKQFNENFQ